MKKNETDLQKKLLQTFNDGLSKAKINKNEHYLVGVSGGKDSVALVHFLLASDAKFNIAHLNHGARETAERDQLFVKGIAQQYNLEFFTDTIDVPAYAQKEKLSFEEAARISRYRFLFETAEKCHCAGVIVGHHADDQVETVLMHLLRGSGIAGLSGMDYREFNSTFSTKLPILRPMLGIWRNEIDTLIAAEQLGYVEDETNADETYYRNRLRHQLLPLLVEYNNGVRQHLWQTSMIMQETEDTLNFFVDEAWNQCLVEENEDFTICDIEEFRKQENGIQRLLIRQILDHLLPSLRDFGYELTLKTQEYILRPPESGQWQIVDDLFGLIFSGQLLIGKLEAIQAYFQAQFPQWRGTPKEILLHVGECISLDRRFVIHVEKMTLKEINGNPWKTGEKEEAWFDADEVDFPLVIRAYQEGDGFSPFGMNGKHVKLSDYFIDHKIPQQVRENYPLVCDQNGIVWVVGERIADHCRISDQTQTVIHLVLETSESEN